MRFSKCEFSDKLRIFAPVFVCLSSNTVSSTRPLKIRQLIETFSAVLETPCVSCSRTGCGGEGYHDDSTV